MTLDAWYALGPLPTFFTNAEDSRRAFRCVLELQETLLLDRETRRVPL